MKYVTWYDEVFNAAYLPYLQTENTYEFYYGGSGSGKSHFVAQKCLYKCLTRPYYRLVFCRKWGKHIRDSQFQLFKDLILEYDFGGMFQIKEGSMDIICENGNMMLSIGVDDPEKVKSIQRPTDIWCEELTEFDLRDFETLDLRLRGNDSFKTQFMASFNPINEEHWIKTEIYDKQEQLDLLFLKTTYKDNDFIDHDDYVLKLNRQSFHNQQIYRLGEWGKIRSGMEYFPDFDDAVHVISDFEYNRELPLHISFDFNVNPYMTMIVTQIVPNGEGYTLNIIDEFCLKHPYNKTKYICEAFMKKYYNHISGLFYYGDSTAEKENTLTTGDIRHDYDIVGRELKQKLSSASNRVRRSNPPVLVRKDFMSDILRELVQLKIRIHKDCKNLIDDFLYLKEAPDGRKLKQMYEEPITEKNFEKYGHTSDALEYLVCEAFRTTFVRYERRQTA